MDFIHGLDRSLLIAACVISVPMLGMRLWYTRGKQHYLLRATFAVLNVVAIFYFCSNTFTHRFDLGFFLLAMMAIIGDGIVSFFVGGVPMEMFLAPPKPRIAEEPAPITDVGVWPPSVQREQTTQNNERYFENMRRDLVVIVKRAAQIFLIVLVAGSVMIAGTFVFLYTSSGLSSSVISTRAFWIGVIFSKPFLMVLAVYALLLFALVLVLYILPKTIAVLLPPMVRAWKNRYETLRLAKVNGTSLKPPTG